MIPGNLNGFRGFSFSLPFWIKNEMLIKINYFVTV